MVQVKIIYIFAIIMCSSLALAAQPTQQFSKIYLDPFYRASMAQNTNNFYYLTIDTPDDISAVRSAIVTFDAYINPTRTFNLTVNGRHCSNPTYTISTTYASAGRAMFYFDCSNIITGEGAYELNLRVSGGNIGAISGWLDLTYMNNPIGRLDVHGTEYIPGDNGKLFLQFLDSQQQPVNNSECFLSMWYPNNTVMYKDTLMSKLDEGIYYKNFVVPGADGVYPASAKCYRPLTFYNVFRYVTDGFESGTFTGGEGWANDPFGVPPYGWDYYGTSAVITNTGCLSGSFCAYIIGQFGYIERGFIPDDGAFAINISLSFKTTQYGSGDALDFEFFNGNWQVLDKSTTATISNGVWYNRSYYVTGTNLDTILLYLGQTVTASNRRVDFDNINITIFYPNISISNITDYQILRGSGEVHVSKLYSQLNSSQLTAQHVWNYTERNLTYYPPVSVLLNNTEISEAIWNYTERNLTYYEDKTNYTLIEQIVMNIVDIYNGIQMKVFG